MGTLLRSVLNRLVEHTPVSFVAPLPEADWVRVFTVQDNTPYSFRVSMRDTLPGWYWVEPKSKSSARIGDNAYGPDRLEYLEELIPFNAITVDRVGDNTWLAVPYNASDAGQRGWKNAEPRKVFLVLDAVEPHEPILVREIAGLLLYDGPAFVSRQDTPDFKRSRTILAQIKADEERIRLEQTTEGRLKSHLAFMGASLRDWVESGNGYKVTWEHEGHDYTMSIGADFELQSAGICLANTDSLHNLSSVVRVMQDYRGRNTGYHDPEDDNEDWDD